MSTAGRRCSQPSALVSVGTASGRSLYQYTRPCVCADEYPHDRDGETCEARPTEQAQACSSALSPHPFRRDAITYYLQENTPQKVESDN
jgi:hypothetical protein